VTVTVTHSELELEHPSLGSESLPRRGHAGVLSSDWTDDHRRPFNPGVWTKGRPLSSSSTQQPNIAHVLADLMSIAQLVLYAFLVPSAPLNWSYCRATQHIPIQFLCTLNHHAFLGLLTRRFIVTVGSVVLVAQSSGFCFPCDACDWLSDVP
jgi:hypothetical protein